MAPPIPRSQQTASIAPIVIGCIDYLAYGTIFTRAMFCPKIKLDVFFPARKAVDACREVVPGPTSYPSPRLPFPHVFGWLLCIK
jgi:hypothetical protein